MALELEGKIVNKLMVQTGTSARGTWAKQEFILEFQEGNYPTQACLNVWGEEKVKDLDKFQIGDKVKVGLNISSREYNGRWYTDLRAWRIEPAVKAVSPAPETTPFPSDIPSSSTDGFSVSDNENLDDLPF